MGSSPIALTNEISSFQLAATMVRFRVVAPEARRGRRRVVQPLEKSYLWTRVDALCGAAALRSARPAGAPIDRRRRSRRALALGTMAAELRLVGSAGESARAAPVSRDARIRRVSTKELRSRQQSGKWRRANGARRKINSPSCSTIASLRRDGNPAPHTRIPESPFRRRRGGQFTMLEFRVRCLEKNDRFSIARRMGASNR